MSKLNRKTLSALAILSLATGPALLAGTQDRLLKDKDLKKVGDAIREYIEARAETKGVGDAEIEVQEAMAKLKKKLAKTPAAGDLLASPADLGYAMWLSFDHQHKRVTKGKVAKQKYTERWFDKSHPLEYALRAPSKYAVRAGPYPLILTIPDEGIEPTDHLIERWDDGDLRKAVILAAPRMPEASSEWTEREGLARVVTLMAAIYEQYAVDFDRIYLAGRGLGVATALTIAGQYPDLFAGVIGRTGDAGDTRPDNFKNLPTYFAGGGSKVTAFSEGIEKLGYDNCTVDPEGKQEDILSWIQAHGRNSYPRDVVLVPGNPFPTRAYWLEVPPSDGSGPSRITATIDRTTNTVVVNGQGVTDFTLHFNDVLLDLDRPITVRANGQEHVDEVPRSRKVLLTNFFNSAYDPGRVFVYSKRYHLPTRPEDEGDEEGE